MKRYAIVRVDRECCPLIDEKYKCVKGMSCLKCEKLYGDTKEQLIRKVAQVRLKQKIKRWYGTFMPSKLTIEFMYEKCLEQAKEIVEFLGVEE